MKTIKLSLIFITLILMNACQQSNQPENENNNLVYSTSFENESEISGWDGITKENLIDTTFAEGKKHSLHIGGGCIQPAASYVLSTVPPGKYKLSFWAKMGQASQSAMLLLKPAENSAFIDSVNSQVIGTSWKYYETEKNLSISSAMKLKLEIMVGGIIFADVYIDNLKIEKIN